MVEFSGGASGSNEGNGNSNSSSSSSENGTNIARSSNSNDNDNVPPTAASVSPTRRVIRRRRKGGTTTLPQRQIVLDEKLVERVLQASALPHDVYGFEILKTVHKILLLNDGMGCTHVALQLPEGLVRYATSLADVLLTLCRAATVVESNGTTSTDAAVATATKDISPQRRLLLQHVSILADVTYGACCVDDLTAQALDCQLLVHYGHSCLVPLQHSVIPVLYVFVELQVQDPLHVADCVLATLQQEKQACQAALSTKVATGTCSSNGSDGFVPPHVYLLGTIQFRHALPVIRDALQESESSLLVAAVSIPQCHPLSPGEVLGCTSPKLTEHLNAPQSSADGDADVPVSDDCNDQDQRSKQSSSARQTSRAIVCFVADGRFHLEATMISHAKTIDAFYRYDPYARLLTHETYNFAALSHLRTSAIQAARSAQTFGILLGTLGRQGNPAIVQRLQDVLRRVHKRSYVLLVSEITTQKLQLLASSTDAWVQVACPRLSVDWGHVLGGTGSSSSGTETAGQATARPVLSPYELFVCFDDNTKAWNDENENDSYPMDYYSTAGGPWSNYYSANKNRQLAAQS